MELLLRERGSCPQRLCGLGLLHLSEPRALGAGAERRLTAPALSLPSSPLQCSRQALRPCSPMDCSTPGSLSFTMSQSLFKLLSIELVMPSNHLILCHPLLLPSIFPSIRVFSSESVLGIRWPKYWSFSFSINPSNEYSGLISFRMDWLDPLAGQRTVKSLLQHHSSKASVLWCSAFFIVHLSISHIHT